jgi:hypothetical protein
MAGIGDLLGLDKGAGQLFLWAIINQLLTAVLTPELNDLTQLVNKGVPNDVLSPEIAADMVVRGHLSAGAAADEASLSGMNSGRFQNLVKNAASPPGPDQLAEALRRGFIPHDAGRDDAAGFLQGIRTSRLGDIWADTIEKLDTRQPGPESAVDADVRGMVTHDQAPDLFKRLGGDPDLYQLLYNLAGEGPTPVEAGVLANRNIIPWDGSGAEVTSFEQAVLESRYKNKWLKSYRELATYRPPPRTITAMLREGSIDEATATQMLKNYGVPDAALPSYLLKTTNSGVQKAKELTEAEIIKLYTERAISQTECTTYLTHIGYSAADAALIISGADLDYQSKLSTATVTAVKALYLHRHIDHNTAITMLDAVGAKADYRDGLLQLWDLEITAGVKSLTVKQICDYEAVGLLTADQALTKLKQSGYSDEDAGLILAFATGQAAFNSGIAADTFNPGPSS